MTSVADSFPMEYTTLKDMKRCKYYNTIVQVIGIIITDMDHVVLRCWDSTKLPWSKVFRFEEPYIKDVVALDFELELLAGDLAYDFVLYGEHGTKALNIVKPKDVIVLRNLHCSWFCGTGTLILHDGKNTAKFNRGFDVLSDDNHLKIKLLRSIFSPGLTPTFSSSLTGGQNETTSFVRCKGYASTEKSHTVVRQMNTVCEKTTLLSSKHRSVQEYDGDRRFRMIHLWQIKEIAYHFSIISRTTVWNDFLYRAVVRKLPFFIHSLIKDCSLNKHGGIILRQFSMLETSQRLRIIGNCLGKYFAILISKLLDANMYNKEPKDSTQNIPLEVELLRFCPGVCTTSWIVSLHCASIKPVFAVECNLCDFWMVVSQKEQVLLDRLCLRCFLKNKQTPFALRCYIPLYENGFRRSPRQQNVFLFPLEVLRLFGVQLPGSSIEAAAKWKEYIATDFSTITNEIQEKMLSRYSFELTELKFRVTAGFHLVFEVTSASCYFK